jgi:hypothetical protein
MPHSSGGGSHGGGSHGGSHSHSSSHGGSSRSGGSSRRSSTKAFAGATRYVYYRKHKPQFVYSNYDITNPENLKSNRLVLICLLVFFAAPMVFIMIFGSIHAIETPKKLNSSDTEIIIEDQIGILKDRAGLKAAMQEFYDESGIVPAVITITNDTWQGNYSSLENYAYDEYLNRFDDEMHWLIVYSETIQDDGFEDWYWEAIQGDDTDKILTEKKTDAFIESCHKRLLQRTQYEVDQAFAESIKEMTPTLMKKTVHWPVLIASLAVPALFLLIVFSAANLHPIRDSYYLKAQPCNLEIVDQEPCNYCGGIYVIGLHTACPHCGAPVKAHDFIKDENGKITQILN